MSIIKEMLELHNAGKSKTLEEMIVEDLGTLSTVDKQLIRTLFTGSNFHKGGKLRARAGQKSPVVITTIKTAKEAQAKLIDDNSVVGLVLVIDEVQVAAIAGSGKSMGHRQGHDEPLASIKGDYFYEKLGDEEGAKFDADVSKRAGYAATGKKTWTFKLNPTNQMYGVLAALTKAAKKIGEDVKWLVIGVDEDRAEKKLDRSKTKSGVVPLPGDSSYKDFVKNAKHALSSRLDKFKSSKATEFTDAASLIEYLIDEGYIDKFKLDGFTYDLYDERITLRALKGKDTWNSDAYVSYKINKSDDAYRAFEKRKYDFWDSIRGADEEEKRKKNEEFNKTLPASQVKVILKLNGGKIVPTDIQVEKSGY